MSDMILEFNFSKWARWENRHELPGLSAPGVYAIAKSQTDLDGVEFNLAHTIIYFGVSGSLKKRLQQFDNTITQRRKQHGGADRVLFKYADYNTLTPHLYVSVASVGNTAANKAPDCLRRIGDARRLEFYCLAKYLELRSELPEFNRSDAPKFSRQKHSD